MGRKQKVGHHIGQAWLGWQESEGGGSATRFPCTAPQRSTPCAQARSLQEKMRMACVTAVWHTGHSGSLFSQMRLAHSMQKRL